MPWLMQLGAFILLFTWMHFRATDIAILMLRQAQLPTHYNVQKIKDRMQTLPPQKLAVFRRLVRSQFYYLMAAPLGARLLAQYSSLPEMLTTYSQTHQIAFTIALAHWIVATVEDAATPHAFIVPNMGLNLFALFIVHHIMAIAVFFYIVYTNHASALGVCGLIFEAPVIFLNLRDLMREFDDHLGLLDMLGGTRKLQQIWICLTIAYLPGRLGCIAIWVYGLNSWSHVLAPLPIDTRFAYVSFGIFFSGLSLLWGMYLMHMSIVDGTFCRGRDTNHELASASCGGSCFLPVPSHPLTRNRN